MLPPVSENVPPTTHTGLLGLLPGPGLLARAGRWILYFPIYFVFLQFKIHAEERLMLAEFPEDYPRYRQRVPQLVPGLRVIGAQGCQQLGKPSARRSPDCLVLAIFLIGAESWLA